jgi:hypothetical protein
MLGKMKTIESRLLTLRCVGCGYDGSLLRGGMAPSCPRCGCDLRKRPARSYAEMEGLLEPVEDVDVDVDEFELIRPRREDKVIHRWLAFLFFAMMGLIVIACLTKAAFAV